MTEGEKEPYRQIAKIVNKDVDVELKRLHWLIIAIRPDSFIYKGFPPVPPKYQKRTKALKTKWSFVPHYGKCNPFLHLFPVRCLSKMAP